MTKQEIFTNVYIQLRNAGFVQNKGVFANQLEYSKSSIASAFTGNRPAYLTSRLFRKIQMVFPQVSEAFLTRGEGPVLLTGNVSPLISTMSNGINDCSLLDYLIAERETLRQSFARVD